MVHVRLLVLLALRLGIEYRSQFAMETANALYQIICDSPEYTRVQMVEHYDEERFKTADFTLLGDGKGKTFFVNTGVEHVVIEVGDRKTIDLSKHGSAIRYDQRFPRGTNANFMEVLGENEIAIRTYERGVEDETLACGTGAVAAAIFYARENSDGEIKVHVEGGELLIKVDLENMKHWLCGPTRVVYRGSLELK